METANGVDDPLSPPPLLSSVTVCQDGYEHCTIYASKSGARHRREMWLSASGESFVALDEMR